MSYTANADPTAHHNKAAKEAVATIMHAVNDGGGSWSAAFVILESVNVGVLLALQKMEHWPADTTDTYHRAMIAAVRQRLNKST